MGIGLKQSDVCYFHPKISLRGRNSNNVGWTYAIIYLQQSFIKSSGNKVTSGEILMNDEDGKKIIKSIDLFYEKNKGKILSSININESDVSSKMEVGYSSSHYFNGDYFHDKFCLTMKDSVEIQELQKAKDIAQLNVDKDNNYVNTTIVEFPGNIFNTNSSSDQKSNNLNYVKQGDSASGTAMPANSAKIVLTKKPDEPPSDNSNFDPGYKKYNKNMEKYNKEETQKTIARESAERKVKEDKERQACAGHYESCACARFAPGFKPGSVSMSTCSR